MTLADAEIARFDCVWTDGGGFTLQSVDYSKSRAVTHLIYDYQNVAPLPHPHVVVDSDQRPVIDRKELDGLAWTNFRSGRVPPPTAGADIVALYYVPQRAHLPER